MKDIIFFIKSGAFGGIPIFAGALLYGKDILGNIMSIVLILFGCIIISILVNDYLKTREARRRFVGHGDLK